MAKDTKISWATATWNSWMGCRKISSGCKFCYMYRARGEYGLDPSQVVRSKTTFTAPLKWHDPQRVFVCSWSDWCIEEADPWRDEAWDVMRRAPQHTYLILTKRPHRLRECLPDDWGKTGWPNVWLGTSVEASGYHTRFQELLAVPAAIHFVSCEPLLGPLNLTPWLTNARLDMQNGIDWVIVGGESGPDHRPMDMAWVRDLRDQAVAAGVPFYFKQDSAYMPETRAYVVEEDGSHTVCKQFPGGHDAPQTS